MNVRKNTDYSQMYAAIKNVMVQKLPQMQLHCSVGKIVCVHSEKGAAVMASEYIIANYPEAKGFSPWSLRRMRDFCRTYENHPALLSRAMRLGWILNVVILEADLTMELREWYMRATKQFGWSKTELIAMIASEVHLEIVLDIENEICDNNGDKENYNYSICNNVLLSQNQLVSLSVQQRCRGRPPWYPSHEYGSCIEIWEKRRIKNSTISPRPQKLLLRSCRFRETVVKLHCGDIRISSCIHVI